VLTNSAAVTESFPTLNNTSFMFCATPANKKVDKQINRIDFFIMVFFFGLLKLAQNNTKIAITHSLLFKNGNFHCFNILPTVVL
jgi:hypothetical protein